MAFDAAQLLRQTFAARNEALQMMDLAQTRQGEAVKAAEPGQLMGTTVVAESDPMAELMDSMEELSFQFEEKEAKHVSDRKMGEMQGPRTAYLRAVESWMATMPDMPGKDFLARMLRNLRAAQAMGNLPDPQELMKELARGSTDPSHQFAMLDILEHAFSEGEQSLQELVRQTKTLHNQAKGPEIRAGINLAQEINARATTPEEMQELRDMYRGEVIGFTKPQDCFRSLLASRGPGGLADAIAFLIAGCGADIQSANPSKSMEELGRILTDLGCVQSLQTMMEKCGALAARMPVQFGEACLLSGEQLTGRVVDLTEQAFVTTASIAALLGDCGMRRLLAQMDFTRELTRLFRQLSPRLFQREDDRRRLVDAAQDHLDGLIMKEEREGEESA